VPVVLSGSRRRAGSCRGTHAMKEGA